MFPTRRAADLGKHVTDDMHRKMAATITRTGMAGMLVALVDHLQHGGCQLCLQHGADARSEDHPSELQSLMRNSYAVFCLQQQISAYHRHLHSTSTSNQNTE